MLYAIAGQEFSRFPLALGPGWCKLPEHVNQAVQVEEIDVIEIGSLTEDEEIRKGNLDFLPAFWKDPLTGTAINSLGMPHQGMRFYRQHLEAMVRRIHEAGKQAWVNMAGSSVQANVELALLAADSGADVVVMNYACPNKWEGEAQAPIVSLFPPLLKVNLDAVTEAFQRKGIKTPLSAKLSPITVPGLLAEVAGIVGNNEYSSVLKLLTLVNTSPNSTWKVDGRPVIAPAGGLGGLSGTPLFPIALGVVDQFHRLLPDMDIMAIGGISSNDHVEQFRQAGAKGVQVSTAAFDVSEEGLPVLNASVFTTLREGLAA